jgi:radical SAM superfamily enzyme YgiQ (UPF0313 family)
MNRLEHLLAGVRQPATYLGLESNRVVKERGRVACHLVLAYPDLYPVGMSYLGLQILYHQVNRQPDLWAERVFAPAKDLEAELTARAFPLCSLESRTPLNQFDLIGFTGQHELNLPDVLRMLRLGGVPLRVEERSPADPLVIMGGPLAAQPEPLAPALDAVFLGDGEEGLVEIARVVGEGRRRGWSRQRILDALQQISGVYLPGRYRMIYGERGEFLGCSPLAGSPARVVRRVLVDLEAAEPPAAPLVPLCRQAGMINRPVRQRSAQSILHAVERGLRLTGHDEVSLLSLSAGDHPQIERLLEELISGPRDFPLAVSLPSLRAETLSGAIADCLRRARKTGFTIAPEAGSERLRRSINKNLGEEDVIEAARAAFSAGWRLIKLYFMIGLPGENEEDRLQIVKLVERLRRELSAIAPPRINVGISIFVPKAHTPFQWEAMLSPEEARQIQARMRRELEKIKGVKASYSLAEMSWLEGVLARGDRRLYPALERLAKDGLLAWSENFDWDRVRGAFSPLLAGQPDPLRERSPEEPLCWDHLDLGPSKEFLLAEREKARRGLATVDCATAECYACGACTGEIRPRLAGGEVEPVLRLERRDTAARMRVRLRFSKAGPARYLGHLDFLGALERALRRAGWPLVYSQGFHPQPRFSAGPACPLGLESRAEWLELEVAATQSSEDLRAALIKQLPEGIQLEEIFQIGEHQPRLSRIITGVRWLLELPRSEGGEALAHQVGSAARNAGAVLSPGPDGRSLLLDVPCAVRFKVSALASEVAAGGGRLVKEALLFRQERN